MMIDQSNNIITIIQFVDCILHITYRKSKNIITITQFAGKPSLRESRVRLKALFDYNPFVSRLHSSNFFSQTFHKYFSEYFSKVRKYPFNISEGSR